MFWDIVMMLGVLCLVIYVKDQGFSRTFGFRDAVSFLLLIGLWLLLSGQTKLYSVQRNLTFTRYIQNLFNHIALFVFGIYLMSWLTDSGFLHGGGFLFAVSLGVLLGLSKMLMFLVIKKLRLQGWNHRNILILGNDASSQSLHDLFFKRKDFGMRSYYWNINEWNNEALKFFWEEKGIFAVYIPEEWLIEKKDIKDFFRLAEQNRVQVNFIPKLLDNPYFEHEIAYFETQPVLLKTKLPLDFLSNRILKRALDIILVGIFTLFIGWWLVPLLILIIYFIDGKPVFFHQKRYGKNFQLFYCHKFRTMKPSSENDRLTTSRQDDRITSLGHWLRKTSLDELPQLWNVLMGEMSLVGPRPHMLVVDEQYRPLIERYEMRSQVKPGLTGLAQVSGYRGDGENMPERMTKRVLADRFYVKNWTPLLDMIILLKTFKLMILGDKNAF